MKYLLMLLLVCPMPGMAQSVQIPDYYEVDTDLSDSLLSIVRSVDLDRTFDVGEDGSEQISLAVIDLARQKPRIGGVHPENFIYPASVYKMYVAAEILRQVSHGDYPLTRQVIVSARNAVDGSREILSDPRPLLHPGDTVTINYLLDLLPIHYRREG